MAGATKISDQTLLVFKSIKKCASIRWYNSAQFFLFFILSVFQIVSLESWARFNNYKCVYKMLMPLTFCIANGGGWKKTSDQHFDPPFLNRLELTETLWWIFLNMTGLQDGENRTSLATAWYPIWWLKTGSSKYNLWTAYNMQYLRSVLR